MRIRLISSVFPGSGWTLTNQLEGMLRSTWGWLIRITMNLKVSSPSSVQSVHLIHMSYVVFPAHIFFDDAMDAHGYNEYDYMVNQFVKLLVRTVNVAATYVLVSSLPVIFTCA